MKKLFFLLLISCGSQSDQTLINEINEIRNKEKKVALKELNHNLSKIDKLSLIEKASIKMAFKFIKDFDIEQQIEKNNENTEKIIGVKGSQKSTNGLKEFGELINIKARKLSRELGVSELVLINNDSEFNSYIAEPLYMSLPENVRSVINEKDFKNYLLEIRNNLN